MKTKPPINTLEINCHDMKSASGWEGYIHCGLWVYRRILYKEVGVVLLLLLLMLLLLLFRVFVLGTLGSGLRAQNSLCLSVKW